jgi:membrane fusion protein, adhesin transport system
MSALPKRPDRAGPGTRRRRWVKRADYADFLPQGQSVAEREAAPMARLLILVIGLLFGAALLWAGLARVDQVATAPGVVRPAGKVKIVNHPDGGRVAAIRVAEGERVRAGQVLIELDPDFLREEIAKLEGEWAAQSLRAARLAAEAKGETPVFPAALEAARPGLVGMQRQLFDARRQALAARRSVADRVIEQRGRDAAAAATRGKQLARSLAILKQQETAVGELASKGYFPKLRYLSIQRQVSDLEGQAAEAGEVAEGALAARAEARTRREAIDRDWRSETLNELASVRRDRDQVKRSLAQQKNRFRNLFVRAPIDGIAQNISITAPGQAISANEPLLSIVPTGAQLIVEARVSNNDIGYISVGQKATVKLQTYDFIRFGALDGIVEQIAADAVVDRGSGQMTFNVTIRTERSYLGPRPVDQPVNPGMQAVVDLHIGKRSILSYLTDRLDRTTQTALRER